MMNIFGQDFRDQCKNAGVSLRKKLVESMVSVDESKHSHAKCMDCSAPPTKECLWAEGMGHAWFCDKHYKEWSTKGDGKGDLCSVKAITDGKAAMKFADNKNPNLLKESIINEARETTIFQVDIDKLEEDEGYRMPGMKLAVIEGTNGWIITNNEAVHWVGELGQPIHLPVYDAKFTNDIGQVMVPVFYREIPMAINIEDLEQYEIAATSIDSPSALDWKKWIHYFGIKSRIGDNYRGLVVSMKKIGAVSEMPDFTQYRQGNESMDEDFFKGPDLNDIADKKAIKQAEMEEATKGLFDKYKDIANQLGFTEDSNRHQTPVYPLTDIYQLRPTSVIYYVAKKDNLTLVFTTDVSYAPNRVKVTIWGERGIYFSMHLSNKVKTSTIVKKVRDDLLPRFEGGDTAWAANYTPKARYKRYCGICNAGIPAGTRHLRLDSGQTVCKDCVKKSSNLLGEGVWVSSTQDRLNEELDYVSPDKKEWIETGDDDLNRIMPELSPEEQKYLKTIASETYEETVAKIANYTGLEVSTGTLPSLYSLVMQTLRQTMQIEASNKDYLEELALSLVFSVPEFKMVEEAYLSDHLRFDIKLARADLDNLINPQEDDEDAGNAEDELSSEEEINLDLANEWEGATEENIKRRFANLMITGGSVNKLYLYNMAVDKLERIDPRLPNYYGILSSVAQLGYWALPFGVETAAAGNDDTAAGSEEVIPDGDNYIIKARGLTFTFLVYELVKGIYEYLALNQSYQGEMKGDKIEDETKDMMAGPGVYKAVMSYIPADNQEIMPLVKRKLTDLGADDIKNILAKNPAGQQIMTRLISDAESEWSEYQRQKEDYQL